MRGWRAGRSSTSDGIAKSQTRKAATQSSILPGNASITTVPMNAASAMAISQSAAITVEPSHARPSSASAVCVSRP